MDKYLSGTEIMEKFGFKNFIILRQFRNKHTKSWKIVDELHIRYNVNAFEKFYKKLIGKKREK